MRATVGRGGGGRGGGGGHGGGRGGRGRGFRGGFYGYGPGYWNQPIVIDNSDDDADIAWALDIIQRAPPSLVDRALRLRGV